jgi:hypothetical protein
MDAMNRRQDELDLTLLEGVIAIDFGTSRSGYAWASFEKRNVSTCDDYPGPRQPYPKTLTEMLYLPNRSLKSWGYIARRGLASLRQARGAKDHYYFRNIKMSLLDCENPGDGVRRARGEDTPGRPRVVQGPDGPEILEDDGSSFPVVRLIADYLKALKDFALKDIHKRHPDAADITEKDVLWVLTVPAIWTDHQKRWMQRAAAIAKLVEDEEDPRLKLVYEPAAAAIYCFEEFGTPMRSKTRFTVVDAGGGTVDLTSYVVTDERTLEEIGIGTGKPYGGRLVDRSFLDHLDRVLRPGVSEALRRQQPEEYVDLIEDWETIKCEGIAEEDSFDVGEPKRVPLPLSLLLDPEVQRALAEQQGYAGRSLLLSPEDYRSLFAPTTEKIVEVIKEHLGQDGIGTVDYLFLVGGFGESKLLYGRLVERFEGHGVRKVVCPPGAGAAVLRGAASFGLDTSIISAVRAKETYGTEFNDDFDPAVDPPSKRVIHPDGTVHCKDRFSVWIRRGERVMLDETREMIYWPVSPDQTRVAFGIYCTNRTNPRYVDETGIRKVGHVEVPMPETTGGKQRQILVKMHVGRTKLDARILDRASGTERSLTINFEDTYLPLKV